MSSISAFPVRLRWQQGSPIISGALGKFWRSIWLLLRGLNQNGLETKRRVIQLCRSDREDGLASIRCLIRPCPNGHEVVLAKPFECVHQLVGLYPRSKQDDQFGLLEPSGNPGLTVYGALIPMVVLLVGHLAIGLRKGSSPRAT